MNEGIEFELKFLLTATAARRLRDGEMAGASLHQLHSVYYDTPDDAATKAGFTLRLRRDGDRWIQTLKGADPGLARSETEGPAAPGALDPAQLLPLRPHLDLDALAPRFETRVERRTRLFQLADATIELALDQGEIRAGAASERIRELELELKSGDPAALFQAARLVSAGPGLRLSLTAKAERGYALAHGLAGRARRFQPPRLACGTTTGEAFQALALAALHQFEANADRLGGIDALEAVHQARVGLRRLRVYVGAFKGLTDDPHRAEIKRTLKRLTALFADARSLDVFSDPAGRAETGMAAFGQALAKARAKAHAAARRGASEERFAADLIALAEWLSVGAWRTDRADEAQRPLAETAAELLHHRFNALRHRGEALDWADATGRHHLRIQAKKLRYLAEAFAPLFGGAAAFIKPLKRFQDLAGEMNDIATAGDTARLALGRSPAPEAVYASGLLVGERRARMGRLTDKAKTAFERLAAAEPFWPSP